jgi:hypothetical protein
VQSVSFLQYLTSSKQSEEAMDWWVKVLERPEWCALHLFQESIADYLVERVHPSEEFHISNLSGQDQIVPSATIEYLVKGRSNSN